MTPAATPSETRSLRRRTIALLIASAAVAVVAALLTARGPAARRAAEPACVAAPVDVGGLSVAVRAQACQILRGTTETHVAVELVAPARAGVTRHDVAMALVIDRSGSMSGGPLQDARRAAANAIDALGPEDWFAVVTYSTASELLVPLSPATDDNKRRAKAALETVRADGGTNISAGLDRGARELTALDGRGDRVGRLVLISDGQANEGIYDRRGLADLAAHTAGDGVSITTVGVGLDFDEVTMTEMATAGRGNYYFVERASDLAGMFERELGSLGETVVVDARLEVTPAAGVEIVEAYGYRSDRAGAATVIPVADLRAGERRKVVLRVRVTADHAGPIDLVATRLAWRPAGDAGEVVAESRVAVTVTDDVRAAAGSHVAEAERNVQEAQMARALDEATGAYERGDYREAQRIIEAQAAEAEATATAMGDDGLSRKIGAVKERAQKNFAAAPAATGAGAARAKKANRADAFDLAR
ncbi:MAG: VWA domain-containing protein [Kofleriaceae bacterium]|nr:VWA domain-containing protein [Myxococcales bacterium]MCB9564877.1 VWA domain-containing protein [Kofleriaceae bacterium]MCB9573543.1 VWA domain-containing protein [Kofleriaceae bacterium]